MRFVLLAPVTTLIVILASMPGHAHRGSGRGKLPTNPQAHQERCGPFVPYACQHPEGLPPSNGEGGGAAGGSRGPRGYGQPQSGN